MQCTVVVDIKRNLHYGNRVGICTPRHLSYLSDLTAKKSLFEKDSNPLPRYKLITLTHRVGADYHDHDFI